MESTTGRERIDALGDRIQVTGLSCSGKSSLAARLGAVHGGPVVELDALNWLPDWVGLNVEDPERFRERIRTATAGDRWIVAGSYRSFSKELLWPRLDTLIWLDPPRWLLLLRVLRRSWQRYRSGELLWGTNREDFWGHFALWRREESLLWWIWTQHARNRRELLERMGDPAWAKLRIIRLTRSAEIKVALGEF